jgi:CheY-like chemotaxis protein
LPEHAGHDSGQFVAAIFNTSPDTIDMLREVLEVAGIVVVSALTWEVRDSHVDIASFMEQHRPGVVIYDVAPPCDRNWQLFLHMRGLPAMQGVEFVITSTNARYVQELARGERVYEVIGKPYDLDQIIRAVKEAFRARPIR